MPETFNPVTLQNNAGQPLNAAYFNRLETGVETLDDRAAALELGVHTPVVVPFATSITLNATQGTLFRCTASGDLTLDGIIGGLDGQTVTFEVTAQGATRILDFTEDITSASIPAGSVWAGTFRYHDSSSAWRLQHQNATAIRVDGTYVPAYDIDSTPVGPEDLAGVSQVNAPVGGVLTATSVTSPGTSGADVTAWQVLTPAFRVPVLANGSGRYLHPVSVHDQSTSNTLTNGTLRVAPWVLANPWTIDRIGAKCTVVGEGGSKLRIVIYSDNGSGYPGALLLDAGQIAGDSATAQDTAFTGPLTIPAGLVWIGGAVQSASTTQPTIEVTNDWNPPVPIVTTTTIPAIAATAVGYAMTGVTGAAPSSFSATITPTGSAPRCHVRLV